MLDDTRKKEIAEALKNASGFIRKQLFDRVDMRNIPTLDFIYDESIEYGNKIEKIIEKIHDDHTL